MNFFNYLLVNLFISVFACNTVICAQNNLFNKLECDDILKKRDTILSSLKSIRADVSEICQRISPDDYKNAWLLKNTGNGLSCKNSVFKQLVSIENFINLWSEKNAEETRIFPSFSAILNLLGEHKNLNEESLLCLINTVDENSESQNDLEKLIGSPADVSFGSGHKTVFSIINEILKKLILSPVYILIEGTKNLLASGSDGQEIFGKDWPHHSLLECVITDIENLYFSFTPDDFKRIMNHLVIVFTPELPNQPDQKFESIMGIREIIGEKVLGFFSDDDNEQKYSNIKHTLNLLNENNEYPPEIEKMIFQSNTNTDVSYRIIFLEDAIKKIIQKPINISFTVLYSNLGIDLIRNMVFISGHELEEGTDSQIIVEDLETHDAFLDEETMLIKIMNLIGYYDDAPSVGSLFSSINSSLREIFVKPIMDVFGNIEYCGHLIIEEEKDFCSLFSRLIAFVEKAENLEHSEIYDRLLKTFLGSYYNQNSGTIYHSLKIISTAITNTYMFWGFDLFEFVLRCFSRSSQGNASLTDFMSKISKESKLEEIEALFYDQDYSSEFNETIQADNFGNSNEGFFFSNLDNLLSNLSPAVIKKYFAFDLEQANFSETTSALTFINALLNDDLVFKKFNIKLSAVQKARLEEGKERILDINNILLSSNYTVNPKDIIKIYNHLYEFSSDFKDRESLKEICNTILLHIANKSAPEEITKFIDKLNDKLLDITKIFVCECSEVGSVLDSLDGAIKYFANFLDTEKLEITKDLSELLEEETKNIFHNVTEISKRILSFSLDSNLEIDDCCYVDALLTYIICIKSSFCNLMDKTQKTYGGNKIKREVFECKDLIEKIEVLSNSLYTLKNSLLSVGFSFEPICRNNILCITKQIVTMAQIYKTKPNLSSKICSSCEHADLVEKLTGLSTTLEGILGVV